MADLHLPDELIHELELLAHQEQRPLEHILRDWLREHQEQHTTPSRNPLLGLAGLLDEFVTDDTNLSTTVRETLAEHAHPQYGWTKRDRSD
jgi:hypothetical protein